MVRGLGHCLSWIKKGLKFKCTQCGKCCKRPDRSVFVNAQEISNISEYLGITREAFWDKYTLRFPGTEKRILKKGEDGISCIFLNENKCQIYEVRPNECATYPFWPQHVVSQFDWNAEAENTCEGITPVPLPSILKGGQEENAREDEEEAVDKNAGKIPLETIMLDPQKYMYSMQSTFQTGCLDKKKKNKNKKINKEKEEKIKIKKEDLILEEENEDVVDEDEILYKLLGNEVNETTEEFEFSTLYKICEEYGMQFIRDFGKDFFKENKRKIIYENSNLYVINTYFSHEYNPKRSLIFKSCPSFVQSEVELAYSSEERDMRIPNHSILVQAPYNTMVLSLLPFLTDFFTWRGPVSLSPSGSDSRVYGKSEIRVCVIGAGCGSLAKYLSYFPQKINQNRVSKKLEDPQDSYEEEEVEYVSTPDQFEIKVDAVDVDAEILEIGKRYFDFEEDENLEIECKDGIEFLEEKPDGYYDIIFIDVAEKHNDKGLLGNTRTEYLAPTRDFCNKKFSDMLNAKLCEKGMGVINVVGGIRGLMNVHDNFDRLENDILAVNLPMNCVYFTRKKISSSVGQQATKISQRELKGDPWPSQSQLAHEIKNFTNRFCIKEIDNTLGMILYYHRNFFTGGYVGWLEKRDFSVLKQLINKICI